MFTGLIQDTGIVTKATRHQNELKLSISCLPGFLDDVKPGDSIAVSGPCLTVTELIDNEFTADVSSETLNRTTILKWRSGRRVNLEKSLMLSDRLGGHFVMGHIDGTGWVKNIKASGESRVYIFESDPLIVNMVIPKGSISIDGISLTPVLRLKSEFHIAVIPHTLEKTTLVKLSVGDEVNIEVDIFARYIHEILNNLDLSGKGKNNLDIDNLKSEGY